MRACRLSYSIHSSLCLQPPGKFEAVLQHVDVHQEALRHLGVDLGDDTAQLVTVDGIERRLLEVPQLADQLRSWEPGPLRDRSQVGAGRRGGREPLVAARRAATDGEQRLVVE